jgi:hypothetical protein
METLQTTQHAAARALCRMTKQERDALLAAVENEELHAAESAKSHPLLPRKFTGQEKTALKHYLLDGGGVKDDDYLRNLFVQAILDDDWDTVFRELPHVVKNWINLRAPLIVSNDGTVTISGFAPTPDPKFAPTAPAVQRPVEPSKE